MKKLIYFLFLIPVISKAQNETSIISVTIQARDCEYIGYFTNEDKYQDIDSSLKSKFRPPANAPSGTTNVVVGGATARAWYEVLYRLRREAEAAGGNNNPFTRIDAAARAVSNTWLTNALDADTTAFDATITRSPGLMRRQEQFQIHGLQMRWMPIPLLLMQTGIQ